MKREWIPSGIANCNRVHPVSEITSEWSVKEKQDEKVFIQIQILFNVFFSHNKWLSVPFFALHWNTSFTHFGTWAFICHVSCLVAEGPVPGLLNVANEVLQFQMAEILSRTEYYVNIWLYIQRSECLLQHGLKISVSFVGSKNLCLKMHQSSTQNKRRKKNINHLHKYNYPDCSNSIGSVFNPKLKNTGPTKV